MLGLYNFVYSGISSHHAAAMYGIFHFLDKRASTAAKDTLASLFKPLPYDPKIIAVAVLEIFDRLYTRPLFRPKAFMRSAVLTLILTTVLTYEIGVSIKYFEEIHFTDLSFIRYSTPQLVSNIFTDYLSLFLIRRWLLLAGRRPIASLIGSFVLSTAIILFMASVMRWTEMVVVQGDSPGEALRDNIFWWTAALHNSPTTLPDFPLLLPGIAVNLWLVFFAIGLLCIKVLSPVLWLSGKMQWFLEHGERHPLDAIGCVGALVVYIGVAAIQIAGRML